MLESQYKHKEVASVSGWGNGDVISDGRKGLSR